jgi:hypothetical protein
MQTECSADLFGFAPVERPSRRCALSLIESAKLNGSTRSTISLTCSSASPTTRLAASLNSCLGTGNHSTPPALLFERPPGYRALTPV